MRFAMRSRRGWWQTGRVGRLLIVTAIAAGTAGVHIAAQNAQSPAPRGQTPPVQVGVPSGGRDGGPAAPAGRGGRRGGGPPKPAPRAANGRVLLGGATPQDKGVWLPQGVVSTSFAPPETIPFLPWAKALYVDRQGHRLEPHARCKASGAVRQMQTPYGVEFVELEELKRIFIFDVGGPHTWRTVYMDGRTHPADLKPTYYGHSIGHWEGDTLVVDTTGYNEDFWFDRGGTPHTERLKTIERFTRTNLSTMDYAVTIDDPGAYSAPWSGRFTLVWEEGTELFEYVCQEQNYAGTLMVGASVSEGTVDRTSPFVP
jgi:hypothetical protein